MLFAASVWLLGIDWKPARKISASKALSQRARATIPAENMSRSIALRKTDPPALREIDPLV